MLGLLTQYPRRLFDALDGRTDGATALTRDQALLHLLLVGVVGLVALPVVVAALVSTKSFGIVSSPADLMPGGATVSNYRTVLFEYDFWRFMWNSFLMASLVVVGKLLISLLAAMAIVYYRFPYKNAVFLFILFTLMLPVPVRFVPLFEFVSNLGWDNTLLGITVPYLASATTVFILRQQFLSIPSSVVETARMDGVGPLKFLVYVLVPMSKGVLVGVSIIMFVFAWNQYLWPLVIIDSEANHVTQVGLSLLQGDVQGGDLAWALVMAGSMLTLLPPLALLVLFRKPLLKTFTIQQK